MKGRRVLLTKARSRTLCLLEMFQTSQEYEVGMLRQVKLLSDVSEWYGPDIIVSSKVRMRLRSLLWC